MSMTKILGVAVALVTIGGLAACDQSKAELDATRRQLQTMTMERDSLKTQLEDSKQRAAVLGQQVAEIQAKLSAAAAALVAPAGDQKQELAKGDKGDKKSASAGKPANAKPAKPAQAPAP
jgi:septal ring factor EnvC (AmiA/AmiB activator)